MSLRLWAIPLASAVLIGASSFASETVKGMEKDVEYFKHEMSVKIQKMDEEIDHLKVDAEKRGSAAKKEAVQGLEKSRDELQAKLESAQDRTSVGWKKFKRSFGKSVDALNAKVQKSVND